MTALGQMLYRLMRDHDITPVEMQKHIDQCGNGPVRYSNVELGDDAEALAQKVIWKEEEA